MQINKYLYFKSRLSYRVAEWLAVSCADPGIFATEEGGTRPNCQKSALTTFIIIIIIITTSPQLNYFTVSQWFING